MNIPEKELLGKAIENEALLAAAADREAARRALILGAALVFGLYADQSRRGFNYTVIRGAEHLGKDANVRWTVIPFENADALDAACGLYGDYDWLPDEPPARA